MKLCADCHDDISQLHGRCKRCIPCAIKAKAKTGSQRRRAARVRERERAAAMPPVPRAPWTRESAADIDAKFTEVRARRKYRRMTLTPEDCWRGAGSLVIAGGES